MRVACLNLESEAPAPARMSFWPFIDLCAIGLFATLFASKFVLAPGISITLPKADTEQGLVASRLHVLTIDEVEGEEVIFYEDRIFSLATLARLLEQRDPVDGSTAMLVRADMNVTMDKMSQLFEIAMQSGYQDVRIATEQSGSRTVDPVDLGVGSSRQP